jgi:hypothetical protein
MMVGSCATPAREPRQARKGAAVSGARRVPQGCLAGATGPGSVWVAGGQRRMHGHLSLTDARDFPKARPC